MSSLDLVHWRHHPPALTPDPQDLAGEGIFSGGAALDSKGRAVITYWKFSRSNGGFCIATSTHPELDEWEKHPCNPLIPEIGEYGVSRVCAPDGREVIVSASDPTAIWQKGGRYYVATGNLPVMNKKEYGYNGQEQEGDTLFLFESDNLEQWRYLHPFYKSDRRWTYRDEDCMCPDFFPLPCSPSGGPPSNTHMLLCISHNHGCRYYLGKYEDDRFYPKHHGRMTWVDSEFFAPESLVDARDRRIMWTWIRNPRWPWGPVDESAAQRAAGWCGEFSLPRVLWLGKDETLRMKPADELKALRYGLIHKRNKELPAGQIVQEPAIEGRCIEIEAEIQVETARRVGIAVYVSVEGKERTLIWYDVEGQWLNFDTRSSGSLQGSKVVESAPFTLEGDEPLRLRVFLDASIVEVFANDRQAIARHVFSSPEGGGGIYFFAEGGDAHLVRLNAWRIMPSNPW